MTPIPVRFLVHAGTVAYLRTYERNDERCPVNVYHEAVIELARSRVVNDDVLGKLEDRPFSMYPTTCNCGHVFSDQAHRHGLRRRMFLAPDGSEVTYDQLQPGDLFFLNIHRDEKHHCHAGWTNCDGNHLHCVLPGGHYWDIDGRASNCTMKDDKTHRCWVRHGDPLKGQMIHVDKAGYTCLAGAGSIVVDGWHGFLHGNHLVQC